MTDLNCGALFQIRDNMYQITSTISMGMHTGKQMAPYRGSSCHTDQSHTHTHTHTSILPPPEDMRSRYRSAQWNGLYNKSRQKWIVWAAPPWLQVSQWNTDSDCCQSRSPSYSSWPSLCRPEVDIWRPPSRILMPSGLIAWSLLIGWTEMEISLQRSDCSHLGKTSSSFCY